MTFKDSSLLMPRVSHGVRKAHNPMGVSTSHSPYHARAVYHPNYSPHGRYRLYEPPHHEQATNDSYSSPRCDQSWSLPYPLHQSTYGHSWQHYSLPPGHFERSRYNIQEEFVPPRHQFPSSPPSPLAAAKVTPNHPTKQEDISNSFQTSGLIWELGENDIVCGRGAPSDFQHGNQVFRNMVADYQTIYLCSQRSEKPKIAQKVLETVRSRGGRFVRRVKTSRYGCFGWEVIQEKRAYEKVCQALRDGAPEFRKRMSMLAASSKLKKM